MKNVDRVLAASAAVKAHLKKRRESLKSKDAHEMLVDLLADLRHWADANEVNFGNADRIAHGHYMYELSMSARVDSMLRDEERG